MRNVAKGLLLSTLLALVPLATSASVPEAESLGVDSLPSLDDSDRAYLSVTTTTTAAASFNHVNRVTRNVGIAGKRVVIEPGNANGIYEILNNSKDLRSLEIRAEQLELKGPLSLPQTNVTVIARDLVMNGFVISTQPVAASDVVGADPGNNTDGTGKNGQHGLKGGSLALFVDPDRADTALGSWELDGGNGQAPGPGASGTSQTSMNYWTWAGIPPAWVGHVVYIDYAYCAESWFGVCQRTGHTYYGEARFPLDGTDAKSAGKPGNAGNGGDLTSNLDLVDDFASGPKIGPWALYADAGMAGSAGPGHYGGSGGYPRPAYWVYHGEGGEWSISNQRTAKDGENTPWTYAADYGVSGAFTKSGDKFSWLDPVWLRVVVRYAQDNYRYSRNMADVSALLTTYKGIIEDMRDGNPTLWNARGLVYQADMLNILSEMDGMLQRIKANLDYYGNPAGWVPLLSFEVQMALFDKEADRSLRIMTLAALVDDASQTAQKRKDAIAAMKVELAAEIDDLITASNELTDKSDAILLRLEEILQKATYLQSVLEGLETQLRNQANDSVAEQARKQQMRAVLKVAGAVCSVFPVGQPALAYAGAALTTFADYDPERPWDSIQAGIKAFSGVAGAVKTDQTAWNGVKDNLDQVFASGATDAQKKDALDKAGKAAAPLQKKFESIISLVNATQVPRGDVDAELAKLKATDPQYQATISQVQDLMKEKEAFAQDLAQTIKQMNENVANVNRGFLTLDALSVDFTNITLAYDPRVASYVKLLGAQAEDRLRKYHYYLAKAYEYRFLETYPNSLNLDGVRQQITDLLKLAGLPTATQYDTLRGLYDAELASLTSDIVEKYLNNDLALHAKIHVPLSKAQLDALNEGGAAVMNLERELQFLAEEENLRITNVALFSLNATLDGTFIGSRLRTTVEHSGISLLEKKGRTFRFNHYREQTVNPIRWSADYDKFTGNITQITQSVDTTSLLYTLLGNPNYSNYPDPAKKASLFSLPGAWADLYISTNMPTSGANKITAMMLEVEYDFQTKPSGTYSLKTAVSVNGVLGDLMPLVAINQADKFGRGDGYAFINRSYASGASVAMTAPPTYGAYKFAGWDTNGDLQPDTVNATVTKTMNKNSYAVVLYVPGPSTNADLSNLVASAGALSPVFAGGTFGYSIAVANGVTTTTVTPTAADATATIKVNGSAVTSGSASAPITLSVGLNTISVVVRAADDLTTKTYTIDVTRAGIAAPTVVTNAAGGITASGAMLNGTVSSNGASTTVSFEYGPTTSYGTSVTAAQSPLGAGASGAAVSAAVGGLACNTPYHFRAVGSNGGSPVYGSDATFQTAACTGNGFAAGTTAIGSAINATPTIITTLPVTCPASGAVLVVGSGESAALSSSAGPAFIGLAYSIARDSLATDNGNVVQSSALAVFNGDANRDFLNVQRLDSCTPGATNTYRLTVYRTTPDTSATSFLWNGRLAASDPASLPGTGFAAGTTTIASAAGVTPTIVSTLPVTCPAEGAVLVSGSGESAALSTNPGMAFVGLAYSIARDSFATDNGNVVQSSALAQFNGDVNRDFLNVQRVDSCSPGVTSTYRLTTYRTTADTSAGSFVWNGRLTASKPLSLPGTGFAAGTTTIASATNATPTIASTLSVTCPASGKVLVSGSGESTAVSTKAGTAFIGLAYSIAKDSLATDNGNVVQSSALAIFNGDANRDFLNVQRVDSCTPATTSTYRLTAYRTTADTSAGSFLWNGRLTSVALP